MSRDTSSVYDSRDLEPGFAAAFPEGLPWVFETDEDQNYFASEDEACTAQRDHRRRNGFDPITGKSTKKYNHAFTLAFSLTSDHEEGEDVTPAMFRAAIEQRMKELDESPDQREWGEAVGAPFDTFVEEAGA